jgi:hypothetical protein
MGRAAKLKAARRTSGTGVQLEELDYLRLVKARAAIDAAMLDGQRVVQEAEKRVQAARVSFVTALGVAGKKYGFDPTRPHRMDDDTHRLTPEDDSSR